MFHVVEAGTFPMKPVLHANNMMPPSIIAHDSQASSLLSMPAMTFLTAMLTVTAGLCAVRNAPSATAPIAQGLRKVVLLQVPWLVQYECVC